MSNIEFIHKLDELIEGVLLEASSSSEELTVWKREEVDVNGPLYQRVHSLLNSIRYVLVEEKKES